MVIGSNVTKGVLMASNLKKVSKKTLQVLERNDDIYQKFNQEQLSYSLTVDSDDDLWVHLQNVPGGVFFYDQATKSLAHFHKNAARLQLNNNVVRGVVEGAIHRNPLLSLRKLLTWLFESPLLISSRENLYCSGTPAST